MKKLAVLVLGCASAPYVDLVDAIRRSWGRKRLESIDVYYVFGTVTDAPETAALTRWFGGAVPQIEDGGIRAKGDVLVTGCPDSIHVQEDCILHKRLIAFDYLVSECGYDAIYTVCAASYVDQHELAAHVEDMRSEDYISGVTMIDSTGNAPFISGASMLLSASVAVELARNRAQVAAENGFGFRDDVAIGQWVSRHMGTSTQDAVMDAIRHGEPLPEGCLFDAQRDTTVDYVLAEADRFRPKRGVFHYHFHAAKPGGMEAFHERYFLHQTRRLWADFPAPEPACA